MREVEDENNFILIGDGESEVVEREILILERNEKYLMFV